MQTATLPRVVNFLEVHKVGTTVTNGTVEILYRDTIPQNQAEHVKVGDFIFLSNDSLVHETPDSAKNKYYPPKVSPSTIDKEVKVSFGYPTGSASKESGQDASTNVPLEDSTSVQSQQEDVGAVSPKFVDTPIPGTVTDQTDTVTVANLM